MDVIIVCHTEFGFVANDKAIIFDKKAVRGVKDSVLNLIKLAQKYNAKITFAVCPEVADYFPKNSGHEIALHVHPGWEKFSRKNFKWIVGDSYLKEIFNFGKKSTALKDYSFDEQFSMIKKGKEKLEQKLGIEAKTFLSGRWSENSDTPKVLEKLGFTHDCSAYPGLPDWKNLPRICMPYKAGDVLMLPVSRMFLGGAAMPEDARRLGLAWLKACFKEYYQQKAPFFHIALHSPVMTDPYYILILDKLLSFISDHKNITFKSASEIKEYPARKVSANLFPYLFSVNRELVKTIFRYLILFDTY